MSYHVVSFSSLSVTDFTEILPGLWLDRLMMAVRDQAHWILTDRNFHGLDYCLLSSLNSQECGILPRSYTHSI